LIISVQLIIINQLLLYFKAVLFDFHDFLSD